MPCCAFLFSSSSADAAFAACSGGASPIAGRPRPRRRRGTPAPRPRHLGPPTITITPNGMTPLEITINVGQRVTFVNNDMRAHDVVGGIDPDNPDCPEIPQAGFLSPGQRRDTGVFTAARVVSTTITPCWACRHFRAHYHPVMRRACAAVVLLLQLIWRPALLIWHRVGAGGPCSSTRPRRRRGSGAWRARRSPATTIRTASSPTSTKSSRRTG